MNPKLSLHIESQEGETLCLEMGEQSNIPCVGDYVCVDGDSKEWYFQVCKRTWHLNHNEVSLDVRIARYPRPLDNSTLTNMGFEG